MLTNNYSLINTIEKQLIVPYYLEQQLIDYKLKTGQVSLYIYYHNSSMLEEQLIIHYHNAILFKQQLMEVTEAEALPLFQQEARSQEQFPSASPLPLFRCQPPARVIKTSHRRLCIILNRENRDQTDTCPKRQQE